jgi:intracellular sulfur oxidation DsrE/DsrF family protein
MSRLAGHSTTRWPSPSFADSDVPQNILMEEIMVRWQTLSSLLGVLLFAGIGSMQAQDTGSAIHIDVPTKLEKAHVVVDMGHLVLNADMPFALGDTKLLADNLHEWNVNGQIVMVFRGDSAHLVLDDETYGANRHVQTGNPYKKLMLDLMAKGVQIELCGATARANHWSNANLLPGIKVDTNAMVRITELEQEGYTLIYQ